MNLNLRKTVLLMSACTALGLAYPPQVYADASIESVNAVQQAKKVTGTVSDAEGPIIGATVKVKGTNNATVTDLDGNFTINAPKGAVLEISYIGYVTKSITVGSQASYKISLAQDNKTLNEVVVVGYGTMKKSDLAGATGSMDEKKMKGSIITNLDQAFAGRVAGVTSMSTSGAPGSSTSIRIRGQATINAGAEPLYVVDGVIWNNSNSSGSSVGLGDALGNGSVSTVSPLSTINPNDIVSMEVLKDASATAIYGAQGANGVVLITTKHGKTGDAKFSYDGMMAWQRQSKRIDMLNLREFAEYYNDMVEQGQATANDALSDPSLLGVGTNWQDAIFRTAFEHQHQLSAQGGTDKVKYYVSGNYMDQDGTLIGSNFSRYGARANLDAQLKPWLKLGYNISFAHTNERLLKADQDEGVISYALTTTPDIPIYDIEGGYTSISRQGVTNVNPVALALSDDIRYKKYLLNGNVYGEVTFLKGLVWHTELGYSFNWDRASTFKPTISLGNWSVTKNEMRLQKTTGSFLQFKNYLTYTGHIQKHSFTAMLGQECWTSKWDYNSSYATGLPSNSIQNPALGDASSYQINAGFGTASMASFFTRETYNYDDRYLATYTFRRDGSSNFGPDHRWGNFHSFALAWRFSNEKFIQNVAGKWLSNGKLRFGWGQTGNSNIGSGKWASTLSTMATGLGTSYRPSRIANPEVHWESQEQTNLGIDLGFFHDKLNLVVDVYNKESKDMLMPMQLPSYMGTSGNVSSAIAAPWGNYGSIRNRGLEITLTAHPITTKDFSWDSEFEISWNKNKLMKLAGTSSASIYGYGMWSDVVSKSDVGQPLFQFYGYVCDGVYTSYADIEKSPKPVSYQGSNSYNHYNTVWVGDIKYKDLNGDGVIDENDRTYIGNPMPKYTFGWTNTFRYKNFDLQVFVNGSVGNKVYNYMRMKLDAMKSVWTNQASSVLNRSVITPIDPNKDYSNGYVGHNSGTVWHWYDDIDNVQVTNPTGLPAVHINDPNNNIRTSDRYIEDGSYLRIKNITLGYTLPKSLIQKWHIENVRVYANLQNLWTITGYDGYDPEVGASTADSNGYVYGLDNGRYPSPTVYSFGLNITF
ncbi:MAG: TonB-dependent receptor [Prevotella sp.]|jgi:TonB-linked SusC/RagA family outer membrane protein|nr:TonB-dependent receptor [Prevotella sp.]MCI2081522.1 TonB-dependent receptor [Prevotella sp.]MCI2103395.1 TonB-dependent receptor [Prevotella sp.]